MPFLAPQMIVDNQDNKSVPKQKQKIDKPFEKTMNEVNTTQNKPQDKKDIKESKEPSKEKENQQSTSMQGLNDVKTLGKKESLLSTEGEKKGAILEEMLLEGTFNLEALMSLLSNGDLEKVKEWLPIIGTVMEHLDVPLEQVVETLNQMGIESKQLSDPKLFGEFLGKLYGTDAENLLMNSDVLKDINKLLNKIQYITENVQLSDKQVAVEKMIVGDQVITETSKVATLQTGQDPQVGLEKEVPKELLLEPLGEPKKEAKLATNQQTMTQETIKELPTSGLGFQIPVTDLSQSRQGNFWSEPSKTFSTMGNMKGVDLSSQIIEKFHLNTLREGKEISMELSPRELGKLTMKITEHQGMVTASIKVDNEKTKEILLQNIAQLKNNLEQQGLTVGSFEVDVRENAQKFEMEKQQQKSSKRIEELLAKHLEDTEEDIIEEKQVSANEIDYMA